MWFRHAVIALALSAWPQAALALGIAVVHSFLVKPGMQAGKPTIMTTTGCWSSADLLRSGDMQ
jgi:hypothetical protein